jgi:hypothetical protein
MSVSTTQLGSAPPAPKAQRRGGATLGFVLAIVLQAIFILGGLLYLALDEAPGTQDLLFLVVTGIALGASLVGLILVRIRRLTPSAGWAALAVPVIDALLVAALVGGVGVGSCSNSERQLLDELTTNQAATQPYGYESSSASCYTTFERGGSGAAALDRYRSELIAQGWTIGQSGDAALSAVRGAATLSLIYEEYGGSVHVVVRVHA